MNPWWLLLIVPGAALGGVVALIVVAWFTRNLFPTFFMPDDF